MNPTMTLRPWSEKEHLRHIKDGGWLPMFDDHGNRLDGIAGKRGTQGLRSDGSFIGLDFIRMQPGTRFPLHVHEGDHEIYFIQGSGFVHIDGNDIAVSGGHAIHIPAEYPHGVWVPNGLSGPLIFAAVGHPHHHVNSTKRMRTA